MMEFNLDDDITIQARKALELLEETATKAGIPSRVLYLNERQKERIITTIKNIFPKISEQISCIGNLYMPACLAIAACSHNLTPDTLTTGSAGVAAAMWTRDQVDKNVLSEARMSKIFSDERFSSLPIYASEIQDEDPQSLTSYVRAVTNRLAATHYQYGPSEAGQRYGASHNVYTELKAAIPHEKIQDAEDTFKDRLMAYLAIELKIIKLFLLKYQSSKMKFLQSEQVSNSILCMRRKSDVLSVIDSALEQRNNPMSFLQAAFFTPVELPLQINGSISVKSQNLETQEEIKKIVSEFDPLHTSNGRDVDPFTIAFAYQHLLDQDDDLAYLPGISCAMVGMYADMLPWVRDDREPIDKKTELPAWCQTSSSIYAPKMWIPAGEEKKAGIYKNPAQILYEFESTDSLHHEKDTAMISQAIDMDEQPAVSVPEVLEESSSNNDVPEIYEELNKLTSENKYLLKELTTVKKNLKKSEHERTTAEMNAAKTKAENDTYLRELRKLRSLHEPTHPTSKTQSCSDAVPIDKGSQFPCAVDKKIVIFGGQDSWRNAISKMIPGVTFARSSKEVDTELIHHADIVWVQTHAISHATYTTVRDCARRNGVPVRLFSSKGISSCAAQLAACAVG